MTLLVVEWLLRSSIRMLSLGHVQKRFLGQIKFVKLLVKAPTTFMIPALPLQMGLAGNRRCDPVLLHSSQMHETKLINEVTCYFGQKW